MLFTPQVQKMMTSVYPNRYPNGIPNGIPQASVISDFRDFGQAPVSHSKFGVITAAFARRDPGNKDTFLIKKTAFKRRGDSFSLSGFRFHFHCNVSHKYFRMC
jgi:hypothetical protein